MSRHFVYQVAAQYHIFSQEIDMTSFEFCHVFSLHGASSDASAPPSFIVIPNLTRCRSKQWPLSAVKFSTCCSVGGKIANRNKMCGCNKGPMFFVL